MITNDADEACPSILDEAACSESVRGDDDYRRFLLLENQHPAAALFPLMLEDELSALAEDIKTNGLRVSLVVFAAADGNEKLLDGRNRVRACERAGLRNDTVTIDRLTECDIDSPTTLALSLNSHRRHLTNDQKKAIAAKAAILLEEETKRRQLANLKQNQTVVERSSTTGTKSRDTAASAIGLSGRAIQPSISIAKKRPDLNEKQIAGTITESQAKKHIQPAAAASEMDWRTGAKNLEPVVAKAFNMPPDAVQIRKLGGNYKRPFQVKLFFANLEDIRETL